MYLGSFTLPLSLHKAKWVQLNGKTLQVLKNSLHPFSSTGRGLDSKALYIHTYVIFLVTCTVLWKKLTEFSKLRYKLTCSVSVQFFSNKIVKQKGAFRKSLIRDKYEKWKYLLRFTHLFFVLCSTNRGQYILLNFDRLNSSKSFREMSSRDLPC